MVTVVTVAHRVPWFLAVTIAAAIGAIGSAVVLLTGASPASVVAVTSVVATAVAAAAPMISLRLAKLPLPTVPSDMDSFRADEKPTMDESVLGRTSTAEHMLTALLGALGLAVIGSAVVLTLGTSLWGVSLAGVLALAWVLRSRSYVGAAQRIVLVGTGLAILVLLGVWVGRHGNQLTLLVACAVLAVAGVASIGYAGRVRHGHRSPQWSRLLDVVEFLALLAPIPLAGMVLNLYAAIRGAV